MRASLLLRPSYKPRAILRGLLSLWLVVYSVVVVTMVAYTSNFSEPSEQGGSTLSSQGAQSRATSPQQPEPEQGGPASAKQTSQNRDSSPRAPHQSSEADNYDTPIERLQHTFPIMVENDIEVIPHPGLSLIDQAKIPKGMSTNVSVPKFFDEIFGHVYSNNNKTIRDYLGNHGQHLMTPSQAQSIGSFNEEGHETIFCSIASYRDNQCSRTVNNLFLRAKYPERIRVAIVDQRDESDGDICGQPPCPCTEDPNQTLCKYQHLMDYYSMDARMAVGPVFARHVAHRMYRGEYFAMQVDSHVRFVQDWDADIIHQWKSARNEMAVLTTYLSDFRHRIHNVTHKGTSSDRPIMCNSAFEGKGIHTHIRHGQQPEGPPGIQGQPTLHPFWAAGFSFARGHFVIQVPYDQHLPMVFQGEEISMGIRGFSYGYDFYTPERGVCFHMYNRPKSQRAPLFWEHQNLYKGISAGSMTRLNAMIGLVNTNDWNHQDVQKYGLGWIRTPGKFYETFGFHVQAHRVEPHLCKFVGRPMMKEFKPALRDNGMGLDYDKIHYVFRDPDKGGTNNR